ncbi:hypothetical protein ACJRPK_05235 [Aquimarina sp. 2-A2]|uniref:hypothetical protein n=1 Tax=Aquimarina sp. 2-A2 TaxID=3382644 RepID=UPI00387EE936
MNKITLFLLLSLGMLQVSCESEEEISNENSILTFQIQKDSFTKDFEIGENSIQGFVESEIVLTELTLRVTTSSKSAISPNPESITDLTEPVEFIVTAEDGSQKKYVVDIVRQLSNQNSISVFEFQNGQFTSRARIDETTNTIEKRVPESVDLNNLQVNLVFSDRATIVPNPTEIVNFTNPVEFLVTAENGDQKRYTVVIENTSIPTSEACETTNAWKWLGGDNRTGVPNLEPYDRNVGTGQSVIMDEDLSLSTFSAYFDRPLRYDNPETGPFNGEVSIKLQIRYPNGVELASATKTRSNTTPLGWFTFDLSDQQIFLEANMQYNFTWYIIDGDKLGVTTSSPGNNSEQGVGFCYTNGFSGQSKISEGTSLEEWSRWGEHPWHFNIKIEGKK